MTTARMARDRDMPQRRVAVDAGAVNVAARTTDHANRDQLVMEHVGLVKSLAQRLAQRLPAQVEMTDLVSVGVLGLIDAATRYKASTGVPFDAFARRRVQGDLAPRA